MLHLIDNMIRKNSFACYFEKKTKFYLNPFFSAYKLFKQAADLGHIEAKEELAFAHLIGVHLPMNFNQAKIYFEQGVQTGSAKSHYVYFKSRFFFLLILKFSISLGTLFYE